MKEENISTVRLSKTSLALLKSLVKDESIRLSKLPEKFSMKQQIDLQILSDALDGEM